MKWTDFLRFFFQFFQFKPFLFCNCNRATGFPALSFWFLPKKVYVVLFITVVVGAIDILHGTFFTPLTAPEMYNRFDSLWRQVKGERLPRRVPRSWFNEVSITYMHRQFFIEWTSIESIYGEIDVILSLIIIVVEYVADFQYGLCWSMGLHVFLHVCMMIKVKSLLFDFEQMNVLFEWHHWHSLRCS